MSIVTVAFVIVACSRFNGLLGHYSIKMSSIGCSRALQRPGVLLHFFDEKTEIVFSENVEHDPIWNFSCTWDVTLIH